MLLLFVKDETVQVLLDGEHKCLIKCAALRKSSFLSHLYGALCVVEEFPYVLLHCVYIGDKYLNLG